MRVARFGLRGRVSAACTGLGVLFLMAACAGGGSAVTQQPTMDAGGPTTPTCSGSTPDSCGSTCVDLQSDSTNCGHCSTACTMGTTCVTGSCACPAGTMLCSGDAGQSCATTQTDPANCGSCGHACAGGDVCSMGSCSSTCTTGMTQCGSACTNTMTDPANCGSCMDPCPMRANATAACGMGDCSWTCVAPYVDADGDLNAPRAQMSDGCECKATATAAMPDVPNLSFMDTNCDGINGTVADAIFVAAASGNDNNPGTIDKPVATIAKGLTLAGLASPVKSLYVAKGTYTEAVTLESGIGIYGGYDDSNKWSRALTNTTVIQSPTATGVEGNALATSLELQLLTITASNALMAGGSSYGVLVAGSLAGAKVTLTACDITAGSGKAGVAGNSGGAGASGGQGTTGTRAAARQAAACRCAAPSAATGVRRSAGARPTPA